MNFSTFGELKGWAERQRVEHHLDGWEGFEYIFRNELLQRREDKLYVNFIETEEGFSWTSPHWELDKMGASPRLPSAYGAKAICPQIQNLHRVGVANPEALKLIASTWRPVEIKDDLRLHELRELNFGTVAALRDDELLAGSDEEAEAVGLYWPFPLYSLDLTTKRVKQSKLRERRRQAEEEWLRQNT